MDLSVLRTVREGKNLSQEKVAKEVGISQEYLSYIERNKRSPQADDLKKLCNVLDLDLIIVAKT